MRKVKYWWKKLLSNEFQRGDNDFIIDNGSELLKDRIVMFHGKTNPIRCFTSAEISSIITNRCQSDSSWYEGVVDGRKVLVQHLPYRRLEGIREIAVSTEMSSHENVHKLMGYCLETKSPFLVFEWLDMNVSLSNRIYYQPGRLKFMDRLRIAWKIAHVVSYLHNAFPRPIIHRDINSKNVFLDERQGNIIPKLSGFGLSVSIPKGKTYEECSSIIGTYGYMDPRYCINGRVDEQVDVYSFGVLLLYLLTGHEQMYNREMIDFIDRRQARTIYEIIDPAIKTEEGFRFYHDQLQATVKLALQCTTDEAEHRPTMVEIATQLRTMVDQAL